ncbi:MAG TPA: ABC transporter substrate-binding protein [Chloroflexota bacterium]|nr:ABC transporter substrate-binding protein [Chloroflexota bacterium]
MAADKEGHLGRYGIKPKFVVMAGSTAMAAVSKGDVTFTTFGVTDAVAAVSKGFPVRLVYVITSEPQHYIVSKKGYKSFADLAGKKIGVDTP